MVKTDTYFSPDLVEELFISSQEAGMGELHFLLTLALEAAGVDADNLKWEQKKSYTMRLSRQCHAHN